MVWAGAATHIDGWRSGGASASAITAKDVNAVKSMNPLSLMGVDRVQGAVLITCTILAVMSWIDCVSVSLESIPCIVVKVSRFSVLGVWGTM